MKNIEKRCPKCLMNYTSIGAPVVPINFCQKCGMLLQIVGVREEQPFHLPEDWEGVREMARKGANHVNGILFEHGDHMYPDVIKSLKECSKILGDIAKDKGTRKETRGMLWKIKDLEKCLDDRLRDYADGLIGKDCNWDEELKKLK